MVRVIVAPDKFRGSLSAAEAARAISEGIRSVDPLADVVEIPMADGGEGTHAAAVRAGFEEQISRVRGPLGDLINAVWALRDGTAVICVAEASGLNLINPTPHSARTATSAGTGDLIIAALDAGATTIVIGLGGSACTDGGAGALSALGLRLFDSDGLPVAIGGAALQKLACIDASNLDPRLASTVFELACDVQNPLLGESGAAAVFAPQKGADLVALDELEAGLIVWAEQLTATFGRNISSYPGAGAAGGLAAGMLAATPAQVRSGVSVVGDLLGLEHELDTADLVFVGEGMLDGQSLEGKGPIGVALLAQSRGVDVIAVAGRITTSVKQLAAAGIGRGYEIMSIAASPADSFTHAAKYLHALAAQAYTQHTHQQELAS